MAERLRSYDGTVRQAWALQAELEGLLEGAPMQVDVAEAKRLLEAGTRGV